jgi:hypothetical protein
MRAVYDSRIKTLVGFQKTRYIPIKNKFRVGIK